MNWLFGVLSFRNDFRLARMLLRPTIIMCTVWWFVKIFKVDKRSSVDYIWRERSLLGNNKDPERRKGLRFMSKLDQTLVTLQ